MTPRHDGSRVAETEYAALHVPSSQFEYEEPRPYIAGQPVSRRSAPRTIDWWDPSVAIIALIVSALLAIGHHVYYQSLNGTVVESESQQIWAIRIGTGLAFLIKTSLAAALGLAAVQQLWATLRRESLTIGSLDCAFAIMTDPLAIFNRGLLGKAKLLLFIAVVSWVVPLITIFTPASLSVRLQITSATVQTIVPTVNFTNFKNWATFEGAGFIWGASFDVGRLFTVVYSSQSSVPPAAIYPNSSYEISYWGPSYKCSSATEYIAKHNTPTWEVDDEVPYTSFENALNAELDQGRILYSGAAPRYMNNIILIRTFEHDPWVCQLHNTSYTLSIQSNDGTQSINPLSTEPLEAQEWDHSVGRNSALDRLSGIPAYYTTHLLFSDLLAVNISVGVSGGVYVGLSVTHPLVQSALVDCTEFWNNSLYLEVLMDEKEHTACRNKTLPAAIEDLSRNFTHSTMGFTSHANTTLPVTVRTPQNFYFYSRSTLLATYIISYSVTALCVSLGGVALWRNGVTSSNSFSTIMLTTRNPKLSTVAHGDKSGAKPLDKHVAATKLQFGVVENQGSGSGTQLGFGL